jgi:hypothetical protein
MKSDFEDGSESSRVREKRFHGRKNRMGRSTTVWMVLQPLQSAGESGQTKRDGGLN